MKEEKFRRWELVFKVIASLLTLATIVIGISQYVKNSEKEFRKELYNRQMEIYMETSEVVSKLANFSKKEVGSDEYIAVRKRFFEIKYGTLYLIQDTTVERATIEFTDQLLKYERRGSKVQQEDMQLVALKINEAFRKSIQKTWDIDLPVLKRSKNDIIK